MARSPVERAGQVDENRSVKKVYSSDNFMLIGHLREVLEAHHIDCVVKNEHLLGGAGELPPIECWPELWVMEDFQLGKARELIDAFVAPRLDSTRDWRCAGCGEALEGQFSECWNCGEARPVE